MNELKNHYKNPILVLVLAVFIISVLSVAFITLNNFTKAAADSQSDVSQNTLTIPNSTVNISVNVSNCPQGITPSLTVKDASDKPVTYQFGDNLQLDTDINYNYAHNGSTGEDVLTITGDNGGLYKFIMKAPFGYQVDSVTPGSANYKTNGGVFTFNLSPYSGTYTVNAYIAGSALGANLNNIAVSYYNYNFELVRTVYTNSSGEFSIVGLSKENAIGTLYAKVDGYCDVYSPVAEKDYVDFTTTKFAIDLHPLKDANLKLESNCPEIQCFEINTTYNLFDMFEDTVKLTLPTCNICLNGDTYGDYTVNADGSLSGNYAGGGIKSTLNIKPRIAPSFDFESWSIDTDGSGKKEYYAGDVFTVNENTNGFEHLFGTVNFSKISAPSIDDNKVQATAAKTGDSSSLTLAIVAVLVSGLVVFVAVRKRQGI